MNLQGKIKRFLKTMGIFVLLCLPSCSPVSLLSSSFSTLDSASQNRGLGGYMTDSEMRTRYQFLLFEHDHKLFYHVKTNVYEGRILLMGTVPTEKMQEEAISLAWQVPGVKAVSNELQVSKESSFVQSAKDKWISTKINTSLVFNKKVSSRNYEVLVVDGTVYLVGIAKCQEELDEALEVIRTTSGVKKVVSYVRVITPHQDVHWENVLKARDSYHEEQRKIRQASRDPSKRVKYSHRRRED